MRTGIGFAGTSMGTKLVRSSRLRTKVGSGVAPYRSKWKADVRVAQAVREVDGVAVDPGRLLV